MYKTDYLNKLKAVLDSNASLARLKAKIIEQKNRVELRLSPRSEKQVLYHIQYVNRIDTTTENIIVKQLQACKELSVLVAPYINKALAKRLMQQGVEFIDLSGNVFIDQPSIHIAVSGERATSNIKKKSSASAFGVAGVKVIFACLNQPGLEKEAYRTIAKLSCVSLGAVESVFLSLVSEGHFLKTTQKNYRQFLHKKELLDRWCVAYAERFSEKLLIGCYSTKMDLWWKSVNLKKYGAQWGGEIAASIMTKYLKPELVTIYADDSLASLRVKHALKEDSYGDIKIRKRFWNVSQDKDQEMVPPLLVYADLMLSRDERNLETARLIYEKYLTTLIKTTS